MKIFMTPKGGITLQYQNQNSENLVLLTLAGDQRAYEYLVLRYQNAVKASAALITKNAFMAEDVAQDAFVTAWMKLNTLKEPEKFGAWVCRIAKNCAVNTVRRYGSLIPLDTVENYLLEEDPSQNPAELYAISEERREIGQSMEKLPQTVATIIRLHYFEGLSVADIADRMRMSEGTVKWQLHDGRKRIRKELCAMNEKYTDTLVQRVMKKVEELKLWQLRNDKDGFEVIYKDVLHEVEELPESDKKYHALADVLMRGWWWIPGKENDALFARIKEAAIKGKNDDVMEFIVTREDSKVFEGGRIEFMRDKQIPMLEKAGFVRALAREWFWLGSSYFEKGDAENGNAAYDKVREILDPSEIYYAIAPIAKALGQKLLGEWKDKAKEAYKIHARGEELRYVNGALRYWRREGLQEGWLNSIDSYADFLLMCASRCDGCFFDEALVVGGSKCGSGGAKLIFASDNETVSTPCGVFEGCQLWQTLYEDEYGKKSVQCYYKDGVGLVRFEHTADGFTDARVLVNYRIEGGKGLLPLGKGNLWEYEGEYPSDVMRSHITMQVAYADGQKVIVASEVSTERFRFDENSWLDMIQQVRNEYTTHGRNPQIRDVSHAIERAEQLAETPMEQAHTKAAASVIRRIMATDTTFNPNHTATGHWNFFAKNIVSKKKGSLTMNHNYRWSFEWKCMGGSGDAEAPLLFNDIYDILQDATNCIWSDEWRVGATPLVEYTLWGRHHVKTQIVCEDGGTVKTKAGVFENCLKLSLDIGGMTAGWSYRGGKKAYWFAPKVGIVRTETVYAGGAKTAVYELTSYEGVGEGYMPMESGMKRRYDALNLTDGFISAAEYTYMADEMGNLFIFSDRTGIRELPPPITFYSSIQDEQIEDKLWESGDRNGSRMRHDINNFRILVHYLSRSSRALGLPFRAAAWNKHLLRTIEFLGEDGQIPRAWLGAYGYRHFMFACNLFGCRTEEAKEEGYRRLEKAFELYEQWAKIPKGEALEVGDEQIYGGIKLIKGEGVIELPDGTRESAPEEWFFGFDMSDAYYGMTAPRGWEWFNSVRGEERFKAYIERAKNLAQRES